MSKRTSQEEIQKKSQEFALTDNHNDGIIYFRKLLRYKDPVVNEKVRLNLAFMLYHQAFKFYGKENISVRVNKKTKNQLDEAVNILKNIIYSKNTNTEEKTLLSARIFLAQIYTAFKNPESIILAKENFEQEPNALMANRLADVYMRLGDMKSAEVWYKKYEKIAIREKIPLYLVSTDMANFYRQVGKNKLAKKYLKIALKNLPKSEEGKSLLTILKNNFNI